ncbi:MAG TPA: shikimate dehydrogenase [Firmicutes bacterium]|nr:shikimate dehydrogenase [Bacillota bacterium]
MSFITGKTRVLGVIGDPIEHTLSPVMQNAALQSCGLDWVYLPFRVEPAALGAAMAGLRALGLVGINVTIPHKERVAEFLDELDPLAGWLGAVNTVGWAGERLRGWNTDGPGFLSSLREEIGQVPRGWRVVILGAGGAARAIAGQLLLSGASAITVVNRTLSRAEALVEWLARGPRAPLLPVAPVGAGMDQPVQGTNSPHLAALSLDDVPRVAGAVEAADLLVQASSYGMHPREESEPPVPAAALRPGLIVYDIVYRPEKTALLAAARERGARVIGGTSLLLHQGAESFRIWTGMEPPLNVMRRALRAALKES